MALTLVEYGFISREIIPLVPDQWWGKHPTEHPIIPILVRSLYSGGVRKKLAGKGLRFGDVVEAFYDAYGERRAPGFLWLLLKTDLVVFRGAQRYTVRWGGSKG